MYFRASAIVSNFPAGVGAAVLAAVGVGGVALEGAAVSTSGELDDGGVTATDVDEAPGFCGDPHAAAKITIEPKRSTRMRRVSHASMLAMLFQRVMLARLCGGLIVGGFFGTQLSPSFSKKLSRGELGGAILFKRNLGENFFDVAALNRNIISTCEAPPILCVDQEGGRVARLKAPFVTVPPLLTLATAKDDMLVELAARAQAAELKALGFSTGFSPVLDVNTNPKNPVIGDRSFADDPEIVSRLGVRFITALQDAGVFACAKHYPGHGDTKQDSHFDLPTVDRDAAGLERIELAPFAAAARANVAAMMSAHVVYPALDKENPATLSRVFCTEILRNKLGFMGVLFSDDLEMRALAARMSIEESATRSVDAGCDMLLICSDETLQTRAHEALVKRAESDSKFKTRVEEASARANALRSKYANLPLPHSDLRAAFPSAATVAFSTALRERGVA
jgi:beta-N-acetylhexosaminidase